MALVAMKAASTNFMGLLLLHAAGMRRSPAPSTIITQKKARRPKASDFLKSRSIAYCVSAHNLRQATSILRVL
jgi:hypothetical protein